jgi:deoxyribodipyrimidine photolyase-related protein
MCELQDEVTRIKHHPKKIALWFSSMRNFSEELINKGINVRYIDFNDAFNTHNLTQEVKRAVNSLEIKKIIATSPGEYHFQETSIF